MLYSYTNVSVHELEELANKVFGILLDKENFVGAWKGISSMNRTSSLPSSVIVLLINHHHHLQEGDSLSQSLQL